MTETVFEAAGLLRGSSAAALQSHLLREPGIHHAEANPVSQVVTIGYDGTLIDAERIRKLIGEFGCRCGGEIVPENLCRDEQKAVVGSAVPRAAHADQTMPATAKQGGDAAAMPSGEMAQMAHGMGHGAGMSMAAMVRDMRNRFLFALALAKPASGGPAPRPLRPWW